MVFKFHFGFGIMHTSNELYSPGHRRELHGCKLLHHQQTLVMAYRCLYEGNISLFLFYIIMFYTARCSFSPAPKQPAKPERIPAQGLPLGYDRFSHLDDYCTNYLPYTFCFGRFRHSQEL